MVGRLDGNSGSETCTCGNEEGVQTSIEGRQKGKCLQDACKNVVQAILQAAERVRWKITGFKEDEIKAIYEAFKPF